MSRKRKLNLRDLDIKSLKDAEEKKFCIGEDYSEVRCVSDFDILPSCETLVSDSPGCIINRDDVASIVDDLNINNNDSLFINSDSCNYDYILSENDLLNSVSENTNFYNEAVTLYSSNCENEILFDNSFEQECCNSFESVVSNIPQACFKSHMPATATNSEIIPVTENLENIVPNLYINTHNEVYQNNLISENGNAEIQLEHNNKTAGVDDSVMCNESSVIECLNKPANNCTPDGNVLNEFFHCKEGEIIGNSGGNMCNNYKNNENNVLANSLTNIFGPGNSFKNLKIFPLRYPKQNGVPSNKVAQQSETDLLSKINKVSNSEKLINVKQFGSIKVNVKKPQLSSNDLKKIISSIKNKNVPLVKYEDLIKSQNTKKLSAVSQKQKVSKLHSTNVDKGVQTINKYIFYSDVYDVSESENNIKNKKAYLKKDIVSLDLIKKPEPFNKLLLFTFAVNIRSSLCTVLTQEDFVNNNDKISYYTGIPQYSYFMALLNILKLPNNNTISPFQMLLLTLMKIRLNLDWVDLAYRFGRSVQVAKDTFGITVYILTRCLSGLVNWPLQEVGTEGDLCRSGKHLYIYSIKLNYDLNNNMENNNKIFICLSNSGHPIHFISKPVSDICSNRIAILQSSGIIKNLVQNDIVVFDKNMNYSSMNEEWSTVLLVLSKSRDSFCTQLYDDDIKKNAEKMKKTVDELRKYKFLFENITCEWVNVPCNECRLFSDVVKIVCGLINLCDVLPFSNCIVKNIIAERRNMKIMLT